ncbi:MAG TPA: hypothetical protein VEA99_05360, partial [Gemmatimonadaceae bacterium]|nr:hypothetical protein [Gemmatimonadaceae bacterium]
SHRRVFVVEQNRDAQLRSLLALETGVARDAMTPVLDWGGLPLTAGVVVEGVGRGVWGVGSGEGAMDGETAHTIGGPPPNDNAHPDAPVSIIDRTPLASS